jgi:type I site-specific restriction endonuclease
MKRIPYSQLVIGLDQLFFGGKIENMEQAEERADTIDAYLEANGWDWDSVLEEMSRETPQLQSKLRN